MNDIKTLCSFDVFDTLLARRCIYPTDIFDIIEKRFPFKNFKAHRIKAEQTNGLTIDTIYQYFKKITSISDEEVKKLKEFEIQTEINNSYLIMSNYNLVKDGDILISDMYFSSDQIMRILKGIGFQKNVTIYSSSCGKSKYNGTMYKYLKKLYDITLHIGDNPESDIKMASINGIKNRLTNIHKLTPEEEFFVNIDCKDFALLMREFRHTNPYEENSHQFTLFNDQIRFNIPFLIIFSHELNRILLKEKRDTLLFTTRDCCLLKHIFTAIYPHYKTVEFQSSRRIYLNYNQEYKEYLRSIYDDKKCLIVDLNGSFYSARKLFVEVFGKLPRVHIAVYNNYKNPRKFTGLSFSFENYNWGSPIEVFNTDTQGTLIDMKNGEFIRKGLEFDMNDALIYKKCILDFCKFMSVKKIPNFKNLDNLLKIFTLKCCFHPCVKLLFDDQKGLEKININITSMNFLLNNTNTLTGGEKPTLQNTFNVLISSVGGPTLQNMLNSLSPQLLREDCLTVVFIGMSRLPLDYDFSNFKCRIQLFCEETISEFRRYGMRNNYNSLLEKKDFIIHGDETSVYAPNAFNEIRSTIATLDTLHIYKILLSDKTTLPKYGSKIITGDIDMACGVIPYELNKQGRWLERRGGDGAFYEEISRKVKNILFLDKLIYIMKPHQKIVIKQDDPPKNPPKNPPINTLRQLLKLK
jgi:hypothetical protein